MVDAEGKYKSVLGTDYVQQVFNRFSKGKKNVKDYIAATIKELESPEGMRRLVAQERAYLEEIGWKTKLKGMTSSDISKMMSLKSKEMARARITEIKNMKISNQSASVLSEGEQI